MDPRDRRATVQAVFLVVQAAVLLALLFALGCAAGRGDMPAITAAQTELKGDNFKVIKANARGDDWRVWFLFFPIWPASIADATDELMSQVDTSGRAIALNNVTQEHSFITLLVVTLPRVTVRADIIEFTQ